MSVCERCWEIAGGDSARYEEEVVKHNESQHNIAAKLEAERAAHKRTLDVLAALVGCNPVDPRSPLPPQDKWADAVRAAVAHLREHGKEPADAR